VYKLHLRTSWVVYRQVYGLPSGEALFTKFVNHYETSMTTNLICNSNISNFSAVKSLRQNSKEEIFWTFTTIFLTCSRRQMLVKVCSDTLALVNKISHWWSWTNQSNGTDLRIKISPDSIDYHQNHTRLELLHSRRGDGPHNIISSYCMLNLLTSCLRVYLNKLFRFPNKDFYNNNDIPHNRHENFIP
jgi:hypothetical protein